MKNNSDITLVSLVNLDGNALMKIKCAANSVAQQRLAKYPLAKFQTCDRVWLMRYSISHLRLLREWSGAVLRVQDIQTVQNDRQPQGEAKKSKMN